MSEKRVFVMRVLFGPKREELRGEWIKLHNEEINDLYSPPNIFWVITSRRLRWVAHVACIGKLEILAGVWCVNLRERDDIEDTGMDGKII